MLESKTILLTLDYSGKIVAIHKSVITNMESNTLFVRYLDESSQTKFLDLLMECNEQGHALGDNITIVTFDVEMETSLLLMKKGEAIVLLNLNESLKTMQVIQEVMSINNELTNEIREHYSNLEKSSDCDNHLQELSKLNSELINYQRALTQKNKELERLNILFESLSLMDELTQVGNRRKFFKDVSGKKFEDPYILVMLDFNFFKQVNDTRGHEYGDAVLKAFATHVKTIVTPHQGEIYRLGGDEFSILVPAKTKFSFSHYFEEVNKQLANLFPNVSIAYAEREINKNLLAASSFEKLMSEVDQIMYEHKFKFKKSVLKTKKNRF